MSRNPVPDDAALTPRDLAKPATYGTVMTAMDLVLEAFAKLDARLVAVEERPAVKYLGVHQPGQEYPEGSLVTRQGSMWCARVNACATPGEGRTDWVLCVKKGNV